MEDKKLLLRIADLRKYFPLKKKGIIRALDGINLDIYEGETLGLVGESGCGKSTLGRVLLKLYPQTEGAIYYYNRRGEEIDLSLLSREQMRVLRGDLQMIFQDPYSSLNPRMRAAQIIGDSLVAHKRFKRNSRELHDYIQQIMEECGLSPELSERYPHQFSGGQRQRVSIARALCLRPRLVVCDEAVSALDVSIQSQIINLLLDLKEQQKLTYLFISHDLSVIRYISDRIAVMYLGVMVELAKTQDLFAKPRHPYTQALLSAIPTTEQDSGNIAVQLEGDIPGSMNLPSGCRFHTRCSYATELCGTLSPPWEEAEPGHFVACHLKDLFETPEG